MKRIILCAAAFSFVLLPEPAFAETTIPTTPAGAKAVCKTGTTCSMVPCGSTYCSAHCPSPTDCYVIVFMKKPKHPPVVNRNSTRKS